MHYTALASGALVYWRYLESRGIDPTGVFADAGLEPAALDDHNARYPESGYYRLVKGCAAAAQDPLIGLHVAEHWHPSMAHALGYAWLASDTLRDAYARVSRFYRLATDRDVLTFHDQGGQGEVTLHNPDPLAPLAEEDIETTFSILVRLSRQSAGESFVPLRVQLRRAPPPADEAYARYFRAPVRFGANRDSMTLASAALDERLPTANIDVARASDRIIVEYLERHATANVSMRVRERLTEQLPSGRATQASVAAGIHVSTRTLQRRLREEGTSFREILDQTRRELAMEYLRDSSLSVNEITYMLGFSEPANFTRAFRRWSGRSPSAFREQRGRRRAAPGRP